jgi:hypothetical protein
MNTIQLKENISLDRYQMAVRVLEAIGIPVKGNEKTQYDPYELTDEDLFCISKSNDDMLNGRVKNSIDVHKRAKQLCGQ